METARRTSIQFDNLLRTGGQEVALLVEYVIEGQQSLVLLEEHMAAIEQNCGVYGGFPGIRRRRQGHAGDERSGQVTSGCGKFFDRFAATREKARFLKEVGRWVSADRQL